ncbi:hypothetical protein A2715_04740 [Candidatus Woesebacteria bacterium RIFCSPHIGHO2_01_FULL_39_32]|uniref:Uncharacterized protein n=1 Tax=Candidatus Woesebacteria bacterium RIFCSPLOWO2_01_FULL_39_25 TaxID=1802521 RepID=A0A1F8BLB6_9BACT|nr:MAG: hypothetical protein A2124_03275 [Candidatus Woesebacteria bacterium GWB1_37_5]OGM25325.1 MAG: hypothetical protein A2715_04740 [Candidatus Woesebacteria bacterium RIFCSPHIGHO2_01_FULL_39_32]OGM37824.1 MAG: hypothetical protein A3F01_01950 [Candidatus Woesebacteria bacterium RIFCSPHIGHO2_12_FULL_38_11]OGM64856.1 MAG: hypothetical protein A2893_04350 [Candidatus Woesebacteria bacterium RIFCSPLOWO2_01_FULL_39_25]
MVVVAFILRVLAIDVLPVGFTPDEASFGYDAYSILQTGKDQWGHTLPLTLESFGDFKPPLYAYLTIPSVALFGLSKFAVRLPNALFGTAAVYITYLLVKELSLLMVNGQWSIINKKNKILTINHESLAIIASLLLAISPWHMMMSRGAFEANLTTFLLPLGILWFLKGFKNKRFLLASLFILGLNLFSYHSARLVTPLIFIFLIFIFRKDLKKLSLKTKIISAAIFTTFTLLAGYTLFLGGATRAKDISIFSGSLQEASEQRIISIYGGLDTGTARLLHNKYQVTLQRFFSNYLQYFSANFLFVDGPSEATYGMLPGRGVLYWFELPFIFGFLYALFSSKKKKPLLLILFWILVAPIPAALTTGKGYAANRSAIMMPAIQMASAIGAYTIWMWVSSLLRSKKLLKIFLFGYSFVGLLFFIYFVEDYFLLSPYKSAKDMLYGNLESAYWLKDNSLDKTEIVMSTKLSEPHIYVAFANSWDPKDYQKKTREWSVYKKRNLLFIDQLPEYKLGKYTFRGINYSVDQGLTEAFLVGKPEEFPSDTLVTQQFNYLTGEPAVVIVRPRKDAYAYNNY